MSYMGAGVRARLGRTWIALPFGCKRADVCTNRPLLHAKMLVLGRIDLIEYGPYGYGDERLEFRPMSVWWSSANWTERSRNHLEVGFTSSDPALAEHATEFVADVIRFSEPLGSPCAGPEPNMLSYEVDDAAMWEAAEEQRLDHLAEEAEEDEGR